MSKVKATKIRFYHWWVYQLYFWLWTPILKERPEMVRAQRDWNNEWLKSQIARQRESDV